MDEVLHGDLVLKLSRLRLGAILLETGVFVQEVSSWLVVSEARSAPGQERTFGP
jgi:hypothetical protein